MAEPVIGRKPTGTTINTPTSKTPVLPGLTDKINSTAKNTG